MKNFTTKKWIIGILIGTLVAGFVIGLVHGAHLLSEEGNFIIHIFRDWLIFNVFLLPITYLVVRLLPPKF